MCAGLPLQSLYSFDTCEKSYSLSLAPTTCQKSYSRSYWPFDHVCDNAHRLSTESFGKGEGWKRPSSFHLKCWALGSFGSENVLPFQFRAESRHLERSCRSGYNTFAMLGSFRVEDNRMVGVRYRSVKD